MQRTFDLTNSSSPQAAVDFLAEKTGLPKARIKDAMNKGACWWRQKGKQVRLRRATKLLPQGAQIQLYYDEQVLARVPAPAKLIVDYSRYSIWYKPHGLLSQGSQWGDHCSLLRIAELELKRDCFLVHRLDADAAGLMMIAHDSQAAALLSQLFQTRNLQKNYQARVVGNLSAQALRITQPLDAKDAISVVTTIETDSESTWVAVSIETGRKHQIRRHMAGIGHPIVGDKLYGSPSNGELQLLAYQLVFPCPITKQLVDVHLPEEFLLFPPT